MTLLFFRGVSAGTLLVLPGVSAHSKETPLFVVLKDKKWGFMDREGKVVIPFQFEYELPFSEGLAQITAGGGQDRNIGFIDLHGAPVIPPKYYKAGNFSEGLAPVAFKTGKTRPCGD